MLYAKIFRKLTLKCPHFLAKDKPAALEYALSRLLNDLSKLGLLTR